MRQIQLKSLISNRQDTGKTGTRMGEADTSGLGDAEEPQMGEADTTGIDEADPPRNVKTGSGQGTIPRCGGDEDNKIKAVLFVPHTEGSCLAKALRELEAMLEKMTGYRIKIQERAGEPLESPTPGWQGL